MNEPISLIMKMKNKYRGRKRAPHATRKTIHIKNAQVNKRLELSCLKGKFFPVSNMDDEDKDNLLKEIQTLYIDRMNWDKQKSDENKANILDILNLLYSHYRENIISLNLKDAIDACPFLLNQPYGNVHFHELTGKNLEEFGSNFEKNFLKVVEYFSKTNKITKNIEEILNSTISNELKALKLVLAYFNENIDYVLKVASKVIIIYFYLIQLNFYNFIQKTFNFFIL